MNQLTLFQLFTNKLGIVVIIITLLWGIADFTDRIVSGNTKSQRLAEKPELTVLQLPRLKASDMDKLSARYEKYSKTNNIPEKQQGMSLLEQAKQQGELKSLFIGDNNGVLGVLQCQTQLGSFMLDI